MPGVQEEAAEKIDTGLMPPRGRRLSMPAAKSPASQLPAAPLVRVLSPSRAGYFTLNARHGVVAAAVMVVRAILALIR